MGLNNRIGQGSWALKIYHFVSMSLAICLALSAVGSFQVFLSKQSLSYWNSETSVLYRFLWDALLLLGFVCQHSIMASTWFKEKIRSWLWISVSQRLVYTIASSLYLLYLILRWQAIPETGLWYIDTRDYSLFGALLFLLHIAAWALWYLQVFLMGPAEMIGLQQVYRFHYNKPGLSAQLNNFYSHLSHPGSFLITVVLWVHPMMTLDRLLLACWLTCYLFGRYTTEEEHYTFAKSYFVSSGHEVKKRKFTKVVHSE